MLRQFLLRLILEEAIRREEEELLADAAPAPGSLAPAAGLADLRPADVWRLALRKERLAVAHYGLLSRQIALRLPRRVFAFLAAQESRHVKWVLSALEAQA
jgi:hypothetical protein